VARYRNLFHLQRRVNPDFKWEEYKEEVLRLRKKHHIRWSDRPKADVLTSQVATAADDESGGTTLQSTLLPERSTRNQKQSKVPNFQRKTRV